MLDLTIDPVSIEDRDATVVERDDEAVRVAVDIENPAPGSRAR
ncbi:MAG TPA: hypothetical protein VJU82_12030 [Acidobacteriaceae bacterium]|nr:hypothetical protein [Acidobacteriaceae bacterium]